MMYQFNSGLGDTIYAIIAVKEMLKKDKDITVFGKYPELWNACLPKVKIRPNEERKQHLGQYKRISYIKRRANHDTTQFEDVCIEAGIKTDLHLDWDIKSTRVIDEIKFLANDKKIAIVPAPYTPMTVEWSKDMMPDRKLFDYFVENYRENYYIVATGDTKVDCDCDYNLTGATTVLDLLDLVKSADLIVAQLGNYITMAEAFDIPIVLVFANTIFNSKVEFMKKITIPKFINKETTRAIIDNQDTDKFDEVLSCLLGI